MQWGPDRWRFYRLVGREALRALRGGAARATARPALLSRLGPTGLVIAPRDLRTSDPTVASDVYAGLFVFEGRALATGGASPFDFTPPSPEWGEALYGFGWLRHLRAADSPLARANARALVQDFLAGRGDRAAARRTHVVARRLISFLSQSPLLLEGADHAFYRGYLRAVDAGVRAIDLDLRRGALPRARLMGAVALAYASLSCSGLDAALRRVGRLLARELDRQIMTDGGHRSRDPAFTLDLLLDLLPLRQSFLTRGVEPPAALLGAIDRMLPFLRLLRHGDASLGHFNGVGATAADGLVTALFYDGGAGQPLLHAPNSGYERLEGPDGVLLVADVGAPPPLVYSASAGAGCLAFELSHGSQRLVVNCGTPASDREKRFLARSTAAHSTAAVGDVSSARVLAKQGFWWERRMAGWLSQRIGPVVLRGPTDVAAERGTDAQGALLLAARHDGYVRDFGLVHERRWRLTRDAAVLEGEDAFRPAGKGALRPATAAIRFHLHPSVRATRTGESTVRLAGAGGAKAVDWEFTADGGGLALEESVFFAAVEGTRRTEQIVLRVALAAESRTAETRVTWRFGRVPAP